MEIFCFLMGILYVYTQHILLLSITLACFIITPRYPLILAFLLGTLLAWAHQELNTPKGLPNLPVIHRAILQGTITSIPVITPNKTQFTFTIETLNNKPAQGLVQLAWYNKVPKLKAGQRWRLTVKMKKPRNFQNPGSYDFVNSLRSKHILWTGYIKNDVNNHLIPSNNRFTWLNKREQLALQLSEIAPNKRVAGVIEALSLNITTDLSSKEWDLFRQTGTTHLFGISGEHIALISSLIFFIFKWLWTRYSPLCLHIPALYVASIAAFTAAFFYALLAGFAPPVQRALFGCFFYTLFCLGRQRLTPWQVWRYALFGVLCIEPHAVFMQGFYFSFLAVACMLLTQQRWPVKGYKKTLTLQLSCLIGLMPLSLYWFSYGSINGYIANLFAIPLVGLLITPLSLIVLALNSCAWSWLLIKILSILIEFMFYILSLTEHLSLINITYSLISIESVLMLISSLLMFVLLPSQSFRWIALAWLLLPFVPKRLSVEPGSALVQVLDVGQGLAVSIRTAHHVLLYDTGDQFFKGSDLGAMVILPFYRAMNIKKIDKIIISHPDKDHRGGLKSIEEAMPPEQLLVNDRRYFHHGLRCHQYPAWVWDDVFFRFLAIKKKFKGKNNSSCILQVSNRQGRVLLTGDIEQLAEDHLIKTYGRELASDILIVPHHGSKTSSSYRFLLEVAPEYAIASLGFDNRFRFPHPKTLASLKSLHVPFYRTDECGMVSIELPSQGAIKAPICFSGMNL